MTEVDPQLRCVKFGNFEVDLRSGELRKAGRKLRLSGQPFQVLTILLEHPGEVVTREELQQRLWSETFVDVEHNLNTSINKIREALGDSAESPRFVETLPRRGYRFIAPVDGGGAASKPAEKDRSPKSKILERPARYGLVLLGVVMIAAVALAVWKLAFLRSGTPRVVRFVKLTNDGQAKSGPLATDGSRVYFNEELPDARYVILQVSTRGGDVTPLPVPLKQPTVLDISKEGTELLVASDEESSEKSLWIQPIAGGSPRRVGTVLAGDAAFGVDGTSIIYGHGNPRKQNDVYVANRDGSEPRKLLALDSFPFGFRFSPNAEALTFTQYDYLTETRTSMEAKKDGTELHRMFEGCCGDWTPDGRFFIFENRADSRMDLWAVPGKSLWEQKRNDKPAQLTAGPLDYEFPLPSKNGKTIFAIGTSRRAEVIRYDSLSGEFVPYLTGISGDGLAFSADGQWVTYTSIPDGTLWRSKVDGSERLQLTFTPMRVLLPRWSPDGKQIGFAGILPGKTWNIYTISSAGGTAQHILPSDQSQMEASWSPDGNSLAFGSLFVPGASIYVIDLKSGRTSVLPDSKGLFSPHWSPDGRYLSGTTSDTEKLMLFDFSTQKWTAVPTSVAYANWSHDGKYLYFATSAVQDVNYQIHRLRLSDLTIEKVAELGNVGRRTTGSFGGCPGRLSSGSFGSWLGLAPDDSPLLARDISTQEVYALDMDWP